MTGLIVVVVLIALLSYALGWLLERLYLARCRYQNGAEERDMLRYLKRKKALEAAAGLSQPPRAPGLSKDRRQVL